MRFDHVVFVLVSVTSSVFALRGIDTTVCTTPTAPPGVASKTKPTISNAFRADIECVIKNKNTTTDLHEYFDDQNNRGAVIQFQDGMELDAWYDYDSNEFIYYFPRFGICQSSDLSTSSQRFLFGYNSQGTTGHMFSAAQALRFDTGATEVYMGTKMVRGILVDVWRSCQYWDIFDATMTVEWYFSSAVNWGTPVGTPVPVGAYIKGRRYTSNTDSYPIEHVYDIFHYRPSVLSDVIKFETPQNVQCAGRKNTKALPSVPDAFSFTVEIVDKVLNSVSYMQEYYDDASKIVKFLYRPLPRDNSPYGTNDLTEIHDFNTGVAYITDKMFGNCTAVPIESNKFDVATAGPHTIRIRNSQEFFYFNVINFTYEGVKTVRNIDSDSWVGIRPKWPPGVPGNSTWQWFFATNQWTEVNTGVAQGNTPVQLTIISPQASLNYEYNFFNYDSRKPDILGFDISTCYVDRDRRKFQIKFPGSYRTAVATNIFTFKYYLLEALSGRLKVSPLRVANIRVFLESDITVTFELLDVAPLVGDIANRVVETDLATAANTLVNLMNGNQFFVAIHDDSFTNLVGMVPTQGSLIETTYLWNSQTNKPVATTPSGYTAGVMAAVGVVVSIASAALGGVFAFFFFK